MASLFLTWRSRRELSGIPGSRINRGKITLDAAGGAMTVQVHLVPTGPIALALQQGFVIRRSYECLSDMHRDNADLASTVPCSPTSTYTQVQAWATLTHQLSIFEFQIRVCRPVAAEATPPLAAIGLDVAAVRRWLDNANPDVNRALASLP